MGALAALASPPQAAPRPLETLFATFRRGALSPDQLVSSPAFRQLAEGYVYGTFWRRHREFVRDKARNLDAEDLLAVAMVALVAGFRDYDAERGRSLLSFLTLKMYQACHGEVRSNYPRASWAVSAPSRIQVVSVDDADPATAMKVAASPARFPDPQSELERSIIQDAIGRLPPLYRRVLLLHHFEGYSFAEIGARLCPARPANKGTVKRTYDRALASLRPELVRLGLDE